LLTEERGQNFLRKGRGESFSSKISTQLCGLARTKREDRERRQERVAVGSLLFRKNKEQLNEIPLRDIGGRREGRGE
jgi:hypothetical protein